MKWNRIFFSRLHEMREKAIGTNVWHHFAEELNGIEINRFIFVRLSSDTRLPDVRCKSSL